MSLSAAVLLAAGLARAQQVAQVSSTNGRDLWLRGASVGLQTPSGSCQASSVCAAAATRANSSGTVGAGGSLPLGKMAAGDQLKASVVLAGGAGCPAGSAFSTDVTFFFNGSQLVAETSSTTGTTTDGDNLNFDDYMSFFAGYGLDGGATIALRMQVDVAGLSSSCSSYAYTASFSSVSGAFDPTYVLSQGTPVESRRRATSVDVQRSSDSASVLASQLAAANAQIAALQTQLSQSQTTLSAAQAALAQANAQIQSLNQLTSDYGVISAAVNNLTQCSGQGMLLSSTGVCTHAHSSCPQPSLPAGVTADWGPGEAIAGTRARLLCSGGRYDTSGGIVCQRNGSWTAASPNCTRCPSQCASCNGPSECTACSSGWILAHRRCEDGDGSSAAAALPNCAAAAAYGFASGVRWVRSNRGPAYQAYCLNADNTRGWGQVYGGGWEIVHTQIGGPVRPTTPISNARLRATPNVGPGQYVDVPDIRGPAGAPTQRSQMSAAWAERAAEPGLQWMKFMVKIQGNTPRGQDSNMVKLPPNVSMSSFFTGVARRSYCQQVPGRIEIVVNGVSMGATDRVVYRTGTTSIGLANRDNDRCGQPANNYITTNGRTTWRRIDGGTTDNSIRHLITYVDGDSGTSASRCTYCCWGCAGWREVIMWGVRPPP